MTQMPLMARMPLRPHQPRLCDAPGRDPGLKRAGIFGGSFDPVHNAHLALADVALADLRLDELLWVPAGQAWQKSPPLTEAADRVAMIQLAIAGEARFRVESCEDRKSTRLNSSHLRLSRMPSSA